MNQEPEPIVELGGLPDSPACSHESLLPCWDEAEPVHLRRLATSFWCEACGTPFTPDEAEELERAKQMAA